MVELSAKKIETRRERVGLQEEGLRGVNASAANVEEAVERLREVEGRTRWFHEMEARKEKEQGEGGAEAEDILKEAIEKEKGKEKVGENEKYASKANRLASIASRLPTRKLYREGRLVHRPEQELKMHTSYLVFAILPREWSDEDEKEAQRVWGGKAVADGGGGLEGSGSGGKEGKEMSKRQRRKEAKRRKEADGEKPELKRWGNRTMMTAGDPLDAMADQMADEMANRMADETANKMADEMANKMADEMANKMADEMADYMAD